ncbi:phosphotransferase [candidate division KSB1 bacterium]|nr:phosphotransferase [candidate division KSB1 bacterium]
MERLTELYEQKYGTAPDRIDVLRTDGSDRKIYRLHKNDSTVIGIIGDNREENEAFIAFSRHFYQCNLPVPEIYAVNITEGVYLERDLGDETLFTWIDSIRARHGFNEQIKQMYQQVVAALPQFQIVAGSSLDYSYCYQHISFGRESMHWDLHYFKHRFLNYFFKSKLDHTKLEQDFNTLIAFLLEAGQDYFLYRDFQSRNVMVVDENPYFIDYQSGRKGALQYDLGALLYDAKANLPDDFREEMIDHYIYCVRKILPLDADTFKTYFDGFVLIRIMQALGAYGYLSVVKGKRDFLKSVPFALQNLEKLLQKQVPILEDMPVLKAIFHQLIDDKSLRELQHGK